MNRRGFLQGIIASAAGSEALVRLATPVEAAFIKDQPVLLGPEPSTAPLPLPTPGNEVEVYVRGMGPHAKFEMLGYASNFTVTAHVDALMEFRLNGYLDRLSRPIDVRMPTHAFHMHPLDHKW